MPLTHEQVMKIVELVQTKTIRQIASEYGVHERTINRWVKVLRSKGIEVKVRVGRRPLIKDEDVARHN